MLIPYAAYAMAMFVLVLVFLVSSVLACRKGKPLRTQLITVSCWGIAVVSIGLLQVITSDVYRVVSYGDCEHWRAIGDPPFERDDDVELGDAWVINESDYDLTLVTVEYGALGGEPTERVVAPNRMAHTRSIDYVGPSSPPPDTLEISENGQEAKLDFAMRTWLTW